MAIPTATQQIATPTGLNQTILFENAAVALTTDALTAPAAFEYDVGSFSIFGLTFIGSPAVGSVDVYIALANLADFSDETVIVGNKAVAVGTTKFWTPLMIDLNTVGTTGPAIGIFPFRYCRVKIENTAAGVNGTMRVIAFGKNA